MAADPNIDGTTGAEVAASWNVRYTTAEGFPCQLTLRGGPGGEVLTKAAQAATWLAEHGCTPEGAKSAAASPQRTAIR